MSMTNNMRGALFMTAAMAAFAVEDMAIKAAAKDIPVGQALMIFGAAGLLVFAALARINGDRAYHPAVFSKLMLARSACEIAGRLFFALALALTPLSSASAILQATPLVVALGAVLFFGEKVGWHRWLAMSCGLAGVLLILRPGFNGFEPASIFAVLGTLGFAGRDLATRGSPVSMSTTQLGLLGFAMLVIAGGILLAVSGGAAWPRSSTWLLLSGATAVGVIAYSALTKAMRTGEVSFVSPFRYSRLLFAACLGLLVFRETPDLMTMIGGAVVVGSGLFLLRRPSKAQKTLPA
ncbi:DMT family transporter [Terrihabitans rhizophilus]|uniref:DMT family transporter n=1 Tax=Terrihabitans rhizophilus TaxID=3092662 RepID=A0ABU4RKR3_9HYPH|nr:DMT family transporter [Terrihabitans sp. PJ23]MDX6804798.1 DMT family transporter [Terrihabitans sp. PJ23]